MSCFGSALSWRKCVESSGEHAASDEAKAAGVTWVENRWPMVGHAAVDPSSRCFWASIGPSWLSRIYLFDISYRDSFDSGLLS